MKQNPRAISAIVAVCFFVSGAAGLVYQIAWARYLGLFLGHTSHAIVAVLCAFMGGMALGNWWLGARADRVSRPLAMYAYLEIGIGIYALIFPQYYSLTHDLFINTAKNLTPGSFTLMLAKFVFSLMTILAPSVMMGATFPVLTRFVTHSLAELRQRVGMLYSINSAGAVAGCLLADFWWVPAIGLEASVLCGAGMNLVAGAVALYLSNRLGEGLDDPAPAGAEKDDATEACTPEEFKIAVIAIGVSGFAAMLYEVAWTRVLALVLGSSTHAFSLMLVTFIAGIATGSAIIARWRNLRRVFDAFGWAELILGLVLLASLFCYETLPFWFAKLSLLLARRDEAYPLYELIQFLICFGVMFIPTVCLGTTLPLISRIATGELARTGQSVGRVFAVNTLGTVLGTALTGLVFLPRLGLARTFGLGIGLNIALGVVVIWRRHFFREKALYLRVAIGIPAVAFVIGALLDNSWRNYLTNGLWRHGSPDLTYEQYQSLFRNQDQAFYRDGSQVTVNVVRVIEGGRTNFALKVNGKVDASTGSDMKTQVLLGQIPMLLHSNATTALIVGLGSGVTAGSVVQHSSIQRVDTAEISPDIPPAARIFSGANHNVLENPRHHLVVEDAKTFLLTTPRQYDIIINEPSNPWLAGVAGVFSREFYQNCRDRLAPGGLVSQWLQLYESDNRAFNAVLATFASVFPYVSIWQGGVADLVLIGSMQPLEPDFKSMEARFNDPAVKADLARISLNSLPVFLNQEIISSRNGPHVPPEETPIHTDYYPKLDYMAERAFFIRQPVDFWVGLDERLQPRSETLLAKYLKEHHLTDDEYWSFYDYYAREEWVPWRLLRSLYLQWREEKPESNEPLGLLARIRDNASISELHVLRSQADLERSLRLAKSAPWIIHRLCLSMMENYRQECTIFHRPDSTKLAELLQKMIVVDPPNQRVYRLFLSQLAWDKGDDKTAFDLGQEAVDPDTKKYGPLDYSLAPNASSEVLYRIIASLWRQENYKQAAAFMQEAVDGGFIGPKASNPYPPLELLYRRINAALANATPQGVPGGSQH